MVIFTDVMEQPGKAEEIFSALQHLRYACLLYTSDAADERSSVDLGGRRIINKKHKLTCSGGHYQTLTTKYSEY